MSLKSYTSWFKGLTLFLGCYLLVTVTSIYLPIIVSIVIAFILNPLVNYFVGRRFWPTSLKINKDIAVLLAFGCATLLIIIIGTFVLLPFMYEFDKFIVELPALILKIQNIGIHIEQRASLLQMPFNVNALVQQTVANAASFSADLARRIVQEILKFATSIVQLVVVPVLSYYFLRDWRVLKDKIITMFPVDSRNHARKMINEMGIVMSGYLRGQVLISIVIGFIVFCGMYYFDIKYPLVLGLLAACTETIPIVGPIAGSIPAIMLGYLVSPTLGIKVVIFYIIVHQLENHIVVPNIMGHAIDLHPVVVIISLLIGAQLLGIFGMMMAVPVSALLKVVIKQLWNIT